MLGNPYFWLMQLHLESDWVLLGILQGVSASAPLPNEVVLEMQDEALIPVECDWQPPRCQGCFSFGHLDNQCPATSKWVPKNKASEDA